jgi:hypothetical protein
VEGHALFLVVHHADAQVFRGSVAQRLQWAELEYLARSTAASQTLAENYVGLRFE